MRTATVTAFVLCLGALWGSSAAASCKKPRVLIVLDKSSSMLNKVDGQTKWAIAKSALGTVLGSYQSSIDFGLMIFPTPNQCGPGTVKVAIGPNKKAAIVGKLADPPPDGGNWTPMAQSLDAAAKLTALQDSAYSNHVLLVTDGWQYCIPYDGATRYLGVNAVSNLTDLGITTHIVGFGDGVDAAALNKMVNVAKTKVSKTCNLAQTDPTAKDNCYYQADNASQLLASLQKIAQQITSEICDGQDNDCNGLVDDKLIGGKCPNQQGACQGARRSCGGVAGWSDCPAADYQAAAADNGQGYQADETACDGVDNDCDGTTDEGCSCVDGEQKPCGSDTGECAVGTQTCSNGSWGACQSIEPQLEICDGKDNNCNGAVDEGLVMSCASACGAGKQSCVGGEWSECTAPEPSAEICDGIDNDCDGTVDGVDAVCETPGTACIDHTCQAVATVGGGCDCQLPDGKPSSLPVVLLALLGLARTIRRRRR